MPEKLKTLPKSAYPEPVYVGFWNAAKKLPEMNAKAYLAVYDRFFAPHPKTVEEKKAAEVTRQKVAKAGRVVGWTTTAVAGAGIVALVGVELFGKLKRGKLMRIAHSQPSTTPMLRATPGVGQEELKKIRSADVATPTQRATEQVRMPVYPPILWVPAGEKDGYEKAENLMSMLRRAYSPELGIVIPKGPYVSGTLVPTSAPLDTYRASQRGLYDVILTLKNKDIEWGDGTIPEGLFLSACHYLPGCLKYPGDRKLIQNLIGGVHQAYLYQVKNPWMSRIVGSLIGDTDRVKRDPEKAIRMLQGVFDKHVSNWVIPEMAQPVFAGWGLLRMPFLCRFAGKGVHESGFTEAMKILTPVLPDVLWSPAKHS